MPLNDACRSLRLEALPPADRQPSGVPIAAPPCLFSFVAFFGLRALLRLKAPACAQSSLWASRLLAANRTPFTWNAHSCRSLLLPAKAPAQSGKADRYGSFLARLTAVARFSASLRRIRETLATKDQFADFLASQKTGRSCHNGQPCHSKAIAVSLAIAAAKAGGGWWVFRAAATSEGRGAASQRRRAWRTATCGTRAGWRGERRAAHGKGFARGRERRGQGENGYGDSMEQGHGDGKAALLREGIARGAETCIIVGLCFPANTYGSRFPPRCPSCWAMSPSAYLAAS